MTSTLFFCSRYSDVKQIVYASGYSYHLIQNGKKIFEQGTHVDVLPVGNSNDIKASIKRPFKLSKTDFDVVVLASCNSEVLLSDDRKHFDEMLFVNAFNHLKVGGVVLASLPRTITQSKRTARNPFQRHEDPKNTAEEKKQVRQRVFALLTPKIQKMFSVKQNDGDIRFQLVDDSTAFIFTKRGVIKVGSEDEEEEEDDEDDEDDDDEEDEDDEEDDDNEGDEEKQKEEEQEEKHFDRLASIYKQMSRYDLERTLYEEIQKKEKYKRKYNEMIQQRS